MLSYETLSLGYLVDDVTKTVIRSWLVPLIDYGDLVNQRHPKKETEQFPRRKSQSLNILVFFKLSVA